MLHKSAEIAVYRGCFGSATQKIAVLDEAKTGVGEEVVTEMLEITRMIRKRIWFDVRKAARRQGCKGGL